MSECPDADVTDDTLIHRAIAGDRDALAQLLRRVGPELQERLRNDIGGRWQSQLDPEDVLQVTFLECFLKIHTFENRGDGAFQAWISRICRNNFLDAVRALERATEFPQEKRITFQNEMESSLALVELLGGSSGTPSRQVATRETHQRLRDAVARLPRDYCQVLTLYDLESHTIEKVARTMGRSIGAVYMLRARAMDYLRETYGSESRI